MLNNSREKRSECEGGVIVFDYLGFGISPDIFKKIKTKDEMKQRCSTCRFLTECNKSNLFQALMADEEIDKHTRFNNNSLN